MKRLLLLLVWLPLLATAQFQQGKVRTIGTEKNVNGSPLAGVVVKSQGRTNQSKSDKNGKVEIKVGSKKEGQAYQLSSVYKKGYELNDKALIGRRLAYSSKTPIEIVLVSCQELNRVKTEIEEKVYQQVQGKYSEAIAALNDSLQTGTVTLQKYRERVELLGKQRDLFEPLIAVMAERYAHTDFAHLDSIERRINGYIIAGEMEKADLLIAEKGNIVERIAAMHRRVELYGQADTLVMKISKELKEQREKYEKERDDISNDLYHKYAIALAQFDPQSAGEYIQLRAELDTTNIDNQLEAGAFALDYLTDINQAETYYNRALNQAEKENGHQSEMVALCLNHLGGLFLQASKFKESLACRREALEIREALYGEEHTEVAACYNNLANIYYGMEKFDEAQLCADSAINIYLNNNETNLSDLADAYTTKGGIEIAKGNLSEALSFYELSVSITDSIYGTENTHSATTINNIGIIKDYMNQREGAAKCYKRALGLFQKIYGEKHPNVATVYSNLGMLYQDMGKIDSAMICHNKALEMRLDLLGEYHEDVANSLNNIGSLLSSMKQYDLAIDFYGKALTVLDVILGNNTMRFATTLGNIGVVYYKQQNYLQAIDYFDEALNVYNQYPEQAKKEIKTMVKQEKMSYEALLASHVLTEEGQKLAQKDYEQLLIDYQSYLTNE